MSQLTEETAKELNANLIKLLDRVSVKDINIEAVVRATIEQLTKMPDPKDDFYERFKAQQEKKKMKRFLKQTKNIE